MELLVKRTTRTANSTIGDLFINGTIFCHTLEPTDRGLTQDMPPAQIATIKIPNKTCIPAGRYQVTSYYSPKHSAEVPLLESVPGFQFIEIHVGNYPKDTDGCLLLGETKAIDFIGNSKITVDKFYGLFFNALKAAEKIFITYQ